MRANGRGAQLEHIPDWEIWRPRSSGGSTWHLTQRAITLTKIVYWCGDFAIPFWEVTGRVTTLSTHGAVTGNMCVPAKKKINTNKQMPPMWWHL